MNAPSGRSPSRLHVGNNQNREDFAQPPEQLGVKFSPVIAFDGSTSLAGERFEYARTSVRFGLRS
jgi:hypothetical protein